MKKYMLILMLLVVATGCQSENNYSVKLNNQKISICGEEKLLTDYTYNSELDISALIEDVESCNDTLVSDKEFYKQNYIELAEDYNNRLQELGIDEYILTDTSR